MPRTNEDRRRETRAALIEAGRQCFSEVGFAATGTPELVRRAGVTRGALYHHFADKEDLLAAVLIDEGQALSGAIDARAMDSESPLAALKAGARAYLQAMAVPGRARLLLVEGPSVLGRDRMAQIDAGGPEGSLRAGLSALERLDLAPDVLEALSAFMSAGFDRAAHEVSRGADPGPYLAAVDHVLEALDRG